MSSEGETQSWACMASTWLTELLPQPWEVFNALLCYFLQCSHCIVIWEGKVCGEPQAGDRAFCASVYKSLCDGSRKRTQWPCLPLSPINNYCIFVVQDDGFHYDIFCPHIACTQLSKHVVEEILSWGTLYWRELLGLWLELPQMGSRVTCGDLHGLGVLWWLPPPWCTDVDSGPWQPRLRSL